MVLVREWEWKCLNSSFLLNTRSERKKKKGYSSCYCLGRLSHQEGTMADASDPGTGDKSPRLEHQQFEGLKAEIVLGKSSAGKHEQRSPSPRAFSGTSSLYWRSLLVGKIRKTGRPEKA